MRGSLLAVAGSSVLALTGCDLASTIAERGTVSAGATPALQPAFSTVAPQPPLRPGRSVESVGTVPSGAVISRAIRTLPVVQGDRQVQLDFVNMPAAQVTRQVLGDMLGLSVDVDSDVTGRISLRTDGSVPVSEVPSRVDQALGQLGYGLAAAGDRVRVGRLAALEAVGGPDQQETRLIPLRFVQAADLLAVVQQNLPSGVRVAADPDGRGLLVTGPGNSTASVEDLIRLFDVDTLRGRSFGLFQLANGTPAALVRELNIIFNGQQQGLQLMPVERLNAVLVVTDRPALLARVNKAIAQLDTVPEATMGVRVYPIQYRRATELADILSRTFGTGPGRSTPERPAGAFADLSLGSPSSTTTNIGARVPGANVSPPVPAETPGPPATAGPPASATQVAAELGLSGPVRIEADPGRNSLIVLASPADYNVIEQAIRRLDVKPRQVFIEAVVAEVTLTDQLKYGLDYSLKSGSNTVTQTTLNTTGLVQALAGGLTYVLQGHNISLALQALSDLTQVKIVSAPRVLVLDNELATLQVGNQIPILTQTTQSQASSGAPLVSSIELRDTGVILAVRARVGAGNSVAMDLFQEVSNAVPTTTSTIDSPTIELRRLQSEIQVQSGDTIALGGLMQDNLSRGRSGIPVLSRLPLVGPLFSTRAQSAGRSELLVLLSPRVVDDGAAARALTDELRGKLEVLAPDLARNIGPKTGERYGYGTGPVRLAPPSLPAGGSVPAASSP